jgi:hypothetical protein
MRNDADNDAVAATVARARYRTAGPVTIPPDPAVRDALAPGERLVARRCNALVDRRHDGASMRPAGDLYVTSRRLLLVGPTSFSIELDRIRDAAVIGEQVVLILTGGVALSIETDQPRLLRVQIAAARRAHDGEANPPCEDQRSPR